MSAYNFSSNTDITNPLIAQIMEYLVKEGIVDKSNIRMHDNLEISEAVHIPLILAVDLSGSIRPYIEGINRTIKQFVSTVAVKNSYLADCIDFCYVTFKDTIRVRRPFGYLLPYDCDAPWTTIEKEEIGGCTDVASALFTTWYMAEERKKYLRDGIDVHYVQPIIIMISDMMHNVDIPIYTAERVDVKFLDVIIEMVNVKVNSPGQKINLAKFAPTTKNEILSEFDTKKIYELNEHNFINSNADEFATLLERFFRDLTLLIEGIVKGIFRTNNEGRLIRDASLAFGREKSTRNEPISEFQSYTDNNFDRFFNSLFADSLTKNNSISNKNKRGVDNDFFSFFDSLLE